MKKSKIALFDTVVLLKAQPDRKLQQGALGTVVEIFSDGVLLVEFANEKGQAYAIVELPAGALVKVVREPLELA